MPDMDVGMTVGLIKALGSPDPAVIEGAVSDWLDDHPEATTTVEDGAISYAKLDSSLKGTVDDVGDLKTHKMPNITYGDPEVVLAETTLNFVKDGDNDWYYAEMEDFNFASTASDRTKFIVEFDGVEYSDLYWKVLGHAISTGSVYSSYFIGDGLCIGMQRKNNCPFCVQYYYDGTKPITRITAYNSQVSHTIKISVQNYENVTITPKEAYYESDQIQLITIGSGISAYGIGTNIGELSGNESFAIGAGTKAKGILSFASGKNTEASGYISQAHGDSCLASGGSSFACGYNAKSTGFGTFSVGNNALASNTYSRAFGRNTTASGDTSCAEGNRSVASGAYSHADGQRVIANHFAQHVFGQCNIADPSIADSNSRGNYVEIVGNGTADDARSNARTLDWSGNEALAGGITLGMGTADEVTLSAAQLKQLLALLN